MERPYSEFEYFRGNQAEYLAEKAFEIFKETGSEETKLRALELMNEVRGDFPKRAPEPTKEVMDLIVKWCRDEKLIPQTIARLNFMTRDVEKQKAILERSIEEDSERLLFPK